MVWLYPTCRRVAIANLIFTDRVCIGVSQILPIDIADKFVLSLKYLQAMYI